MKKTMLFSVASLLGIALLVGSCGKYPEGPNFALSSKASRLAGDWKATSVNQSGTEWNLSNLSLTNSLTKDGTFKASTVITVFGVPTTYSKDTMEILMLKKDMVKLKQFDYDSGDTFTYTYEPK